MSRTADGPNKLPFFVADMVNAIALCICACPARSLTHKSQPALTSIHTFCQLSAYVGHPGGDGRADLPPLRPQCHAVTPTVA